MVGGVVCGVVCGVGGSGAGGRVFCLGTGVIAAGVPLRVANGRGRDVTSPSVFLVGPAESVGGSETSCGGS